MLSDLHKTINIEHMNVGEEFFKKYLMLNTIKKSVFYI
jgi:hypothetical protein